MSTNISSSNPYTLFILSKTYTFVKIEDHSNEFFFGKTPLIGQTLLQAAGEENSVCAQYILQCISIAQNNQAHSHVEYISQLSEKEAVKTSVHVKYKEESELFYLYLTNSDNKTDLTPIAKTKTLFFETVYDNLPILIAICDKDGILQEINKYGLDITGVEKESDIIGVDLFKNPALSKERQNELKDGKDLSFVIDYNSSILHNYYKTKKTTVSTLEVNIWIIRDHEKTTSGYLIIAKDITEYILLQNQNISQLNYYNSISNSLPTGICVFNENSKPAFVNNAFCEMFGTEYGFTENSCPIDIIDKQILPFDVKAVIQKGEPTEVTFPYSKGTHQIHIYCIGRIINSINNQPGAYAFIFTDVTASVKQTEILRLNKYKTELVIKDSKSMLWEFDTKTQNFTTDDSFSSISKFGNVISAENYKKIVCSDNREELESIIDRMKTGEDFSFSINILIHVPNQEESQHRSLRGSSFEFDKNGKVVKYIGSSQDNSELQKKSILQKNILNNIPLPLLIKDVEDNFRYIFCNNESKRMFGVVEDKPTIDITTEDSVKRIHKNDLEVFNSGKPYLGQERVVLKDGRTYDTIVRKSIIKDGSKRLLLNIWWDQKLQNDLKRRSKLFSLALENMNAYMWFYEPAHRKITFGEGFEKHVRDVSSFDNMDDYLQCIHPEDRNNFKETLDRVVEKGSGEWHIEYRFSFDKNKTYQWWETKGVAETTLYADVAYCYLFGMSISVDQYKKTELTLIKNKEKLKKLVLQNELILNNINSAIVFVSTDYIVQWENISTNSANTSFWKYRKNEFCFKSTLNRDEPCDECIMKMVLKSQKTEKLILKMNNNSIVEILGVPVFNENKQIEGVVVRMDDITERETMISELKRAKFEAEQSDKLKSAFLANMSHEIRTPLNAIVGFSEMLMSADDEEEKKEYLKIISNNNELLLKLINDILDLSKIEAGSIELKHELFNLSEYFNTLSAIMEQRVKNPKIKFVATNPYLKCNVTLDRNRVAQILTNYVTNSIKYTVEGRIEMGYEYVSGKGIYLYVKDTGIGIAEDKKKKVFQRFEKLDEFAQGTGLGLSICKAIAESMGGSVGFKSEAGVGSLFWAILPCEADISLDF